VNLESQKIVSLFFGGGGGGGGEKERGGEGEGERGRRRRREGVEDKRLCFGGGGGGEEWRSIQFSRVGSLGKCALAISPRR